MRRKSKKKKIKALDLYVIFSIVSLIIYTIVSQIIATKYGIMLDTLTTCFFGFFGGEIVTCGLIKIFKLRDDKKDNILTQNNNENIDDLTYINLNDNNAVG